MTTNAFSVLPLLLAAFSTFFVSSVPAPATPVTRTPSVRSTEFCDCVGSAPAEPDIELDARMTFGSVTTEVLSNGTCNPVCEPMNPCQFRGHYEVGTAAQGGAGPFHTDDQPAINSIYVSNFQAIQWHRDFEADCGLGELSTVNFIKSSDLTDLGSITFYGECANCSAPDGG